MLEFKLSKMKNKKLVFQMIIVLMKIPFNFFEITILSLFFHLLDVVEEWLIGNFMGNT